jgi:hypothetical protein
LVLIRLNVRRNIRLNVRRGVRRLVVDRLLVLVWVDVRLLYGWHVRLIVWLLYGWSIVRLAVATKVIAAKVIPVVHHVVETHLPASGVARYGRPQIVTEAGDVVH